MTVASMIVPVLVSVVAVFVVSSICWMVLPHHRSDMKHLANEDQVLDLVRTQGLEPGIYSAPDCTNRKDPAVQAKMKRGPLVMLLVMGPVSMGKAMGAWILHLVLVGSLVACVLSTALVPGAAFGAIFHYAAVVSGACYVLGPMPNSIWRGHPWKHTLKTMADGVAYALATGAVFGWLWPRG